MYLHHLKQATTTPATQAFHIGTAASHLHQVQAFIHCCNHYYITNLTTTFVASKRVHNYVSLGQVS